MRNLKLNREKLQLKCSETTFIGHVLTSEGVKPDPSKVEAILKMERPSDVAAVRRLVGLTNYLSKFLSQLSELYRRYQCLKRAVIFETMLAHYSELAGQTDHFTERIHQFLKDW